jgi:hypothetical protein
VAKAGRSLYQLAFQKVGAVSRPRFIGLWQWSPTFLRGSQIGITNPVAPEAELLARPLCDQAGETLLSLLPNCSDSTPLRLQRELIEHVPPLLPKTVPLAEELKFYLNKDSVL